MSQKNLINRIRKYQDRLVVVQNVIHKDIAILEAQLLKAFDDLWAKRFRGITNYRLAGVQGGCMTNEWVPEVYLYSIADLHVTPTGQWFNNRNQVREPPVPLKDLAQFRKDFKALTGVTMKIAEREMRE